MSFEKKKRETERKRGRGSSRRTASYFGHGLRNREIIVFEEWIRSKMSNRSVVKERPWSLDWWMTYPEERPKSPTNNSRRTTNHVRASRRAPSFGRSFFLYSVRIFRKCDTRHFDFPRSGGLPRARSGANRSRAIVNNSIFVCREKSGGR